MTVNIDTTDIKQAARRVLEEIFPADDFFGLPATGRDFAYRQMHIIRVVDGKGAEHWAVRDDAALMQQLTGRW